MKPLKNPYPFELRAFIIENFLSLEEMAELMGVTVKKLKQRLTMKYPVLTSHEAGRLKREFGDDVVGNYLDFRPRKQDIIYPKPLRKRKKKSHLE